MIVELKVSAGATKSEFPIFPGDEKSLDHGCICPEQIHWPEKLIIESDCPVHELERVKN